MTRPLLAALGLAFAAGTCAAAEPATAPDLSALIECRQDIAAYAHGIVPVLNDPAAAEALGWQALPRSNPFMSEFRLPAPVAAFGASSDHLVVSGGTIMLLLDGPDPRTLAKRLQLETGVDTPEKFMAGREVASRDVVTPGTGEKMVESVILSVSDVRSHPGKTLAGCTYDLDKP
ncbi:hypothetical protein [[Pseudomonas] boreopolis]|uniref:hypothetical protein n=1 Tax=Xanthomonas boreopolis TaxID=86183 RepID=UPI003D4904F0